MKLRRTKAPSSPFGQMLHDIRLGRGWQQKQMADALRISPVTMCTMETRGRQPTNRTVEKYLSRLAEYDRKHGIQATEASVPLRDRWYTVPLYPQKLFCGSCKRTGTLTIREILERDLGYPRYCPWCGARLLPPVRTSEIL